MFNVFVIDSFTSSDNKNVELLPFQKCPVIDPLTKTLRSRSLFIDHLLAPRLFSEPINYIPLIYISGQLIQESRSTKKKL